MPEGVSYPPCDMLEKGSRMLQLQHMNRTNFDDNINLIRLSDETGHGSLWIWCRMACIVEFLADISYGIIIHYAASRASQCIFRRCPPQLRQI
jgi:hypothetical protein